MKPLETSGNASGGSSRPRTPSRFSGLLWLWLVACIGGWVVIGVAWFNSVDLRELGTQGNLRKLNETRGFVRGYYFLGLENMVLQSCPTQPSVWQGEDYPVLWVDHEDALLDSPRFIWPVLRLLWPDEEQGFCLFYGTIKTDGQFGHLGGSDNELGRAFCIWRPVYTWFLLFLNAIPLWILASRVMKSCDGRRALSA